MPPWRPLEERFSEKYLVNDRTGCWEWQGSRIPQGYGMIKGSDGKNKPAHRVAYELRVGPIPDGMLVLHDCDNTSCVNPKHLFLGTYVENMADLQRKGRARSLTEAQARELVADMESGMFQSEAAIKYGVSRSTIQNTLRLVKSAGFGGNHTAKNLKKYIRLSDRQIIEIVCLLHAGEIPILTIAERYNVDRKTIRNIRDKMI